MDRCGSTLTYVLVKEIKPVNPIEGTLSLQTISPCRLHHLRTRKINYLKNVEFPESVVDIGDVKYRLL